LPDRLDLALWIADPANPLTSRVSVNHIWQHLFGRGLVNTPEDFGTRGEPPSHPELLDWLATEFLKRGWSRKTMIKLIVTSATYRQSSHTRPELIDRDPQNSLLARQNRFRVESEIIRDLYLTAGGLLNAEIGGPSFRPKMSDDIKAFGGAGAFTWVDSDGPEKYRRGVYIYAQRTVPYPASMTFDQANPSEACTRRERSNTPLQALTLLNHDIFVECAQGLGRRMLTQPGARTFLSAATQDGSGAVEVENLSRDRELLRTGMSARPLSQKIDYGFQLCLGRSPTKEEMGRLEKLYDDELKLACAGPESATKLTAGLKIGKSQVAEMSAFIALAQVLMNLDEFMTRE